MAPKPGAAPSKRKDPPQPGGSNGSSSQGGGRPGLSGRGAKRVKMQDARSIVSQPADAALKDGELDLQAFLSAQEFQIRALEEGMRRSKAVNNRRAFQLVPRSMRRRTASHNVKRVPKRLRRRAIKEQMEDNTPTIEARRRKPRTTRARIRAATAKRLGILAEKKRRKKLKVAEERKGGAAAAAAEGEKAAMKQLIETRPARPKIRRNQLNEPPKAKAKFRKRQIEKTWLPTHLWHAKRSRMTQPKEPLWRFAVPLTPADKVYRPTHRAAGERGAIMWDMSYMSTIGLYGSSPAALERVLEAIGLTHESLWDDRGRKWRDGCRKWSGMLSRAAKEARRDIGPATVFWNPERAVETVADGAAQAPKRQRQIYIRVHPACFLELFKLLTKLVKRESPRPYVEDLRFEIGSIEITGPGSTEALLGVLRPYYSKSEGKEGQASLFASLNGITNAASLPPDALLGFSAQDPRLHYPPKKLDTPESPGSRLAETLARWPVGDGLKPFGLFDRDARFKASGLPSKKSLDRRKAANTPGDPLPVMTVDPPIPIILFVSRSPSGRQAQGTWTLLAPWKCILPIWTSLVHFPLASGGNPRFGGLTELQQVAFEQDRPWFPGDYPWTDAGAEWETDQRSRRQRQWERRPKSKRVAWESLDLGAGRKGEIGSGFACEFERLFNLQAPSEETKSQQDDTQTTVDPDRMDVDKPEQAAKESQETEPASKKRGNAQPIYELHHLSRSSFHALFSPSNISPQPPNPLVTVRLTYLTRGVPSPCARVYRLPTSALTALPSTQAEVPATEPPPGPSILPSDLRDQWLARITGQPSEASRTSLATALAPSKAPAVPTPKRFPANATPEARKRMLAHSLLTTELPYPPPRPNKADVGGHPLVPDERDLLGYVTTGTYSLSEGRGAGVGCISAERALEALRTGQRDGEAGGGRVCVVRNAGESVGWLAKWEVI